MPTYLEPESQSFVSPAFGPEAIDPVVPGIGETFGAAFRQENDVFAVADLLKRQAFPRQQGFDLVNSLEQRGLVDEGDAYVGVQSDAELDDRIQRRRKEATDRDTLSRAGIPGLLASVAAGAVSPTTLIPFVRGATGLRSIGAAALSVAAGTAAQEAALMADQESRTGGEVGFSIAASMVLGGLFGAVGHTLRPQDIQKMASDMVRTPGMEYVSPPVPFTHESSVGAAQKIGVQDAGSLKNGWGAKSLAWLSPVTRGFEQWNAPKPLKDVGGSGQVRKMTAGFSQAGLGLRSNSEWIAASPGGNVEDLKKTYASISYAGHKAIEDSFIEYALGKASGPFQRERAITAAYRAADKMDFQQFKSAITEALWKGLPADTNPVVLKAAKEIDEKVYKPLYDEAVEVGIFTGEEKLVGDLGYANRIYNHDAIIKRRSDFVNLLANNYAKQLEKQFGEGVEKLTERTARDQQLLEDMSLTVEEVKKLRDELQGKMEELEQSAPEAVTKVLDENKMRAGALKSLRKQIEAAQRGPAGETPDAALKRIGEIGKMQESERLITKAIKDAIGLGGEDLQKFQASKREIKRRLWSLGKAHALVSDRLERKLAKIEKNEADQIDTILRAQRQLGRLAKLLTSTDGKLEKELSKAKDMFEADAKRFDELEQQRVALEQDGELPAGLKSDLPPEQALAQKTDKVAGKLNDLAARIDELDSFDREAWTKEINDAMRDMAETHAELNAKRVLRNERLWKQVENMSPEAVAARKTALETRMKERPVEFAGRWKGKASDLDLLAGKADFVPHAKEMAEDIVTKILGTERRLAYSDIIRDKRGAELARLLNISSNEIKDFLETDIEKQVAIYTRTLGSDISIARVFGSPDAAEEFAKLTDEMTAAIASVDKMTTKDGQPLADATKEKLRQDYYKFYEDSRKDLYVLLERAKSIRGLPRDPDSWSARGARMAMDLNYLRFMGGVVISSIADPARAIMRHGFIRTMRDGVVPMITNLKAIRASQREAKLAGTALDQVMHTRLYALTDIFDDAYRGTIAERGLHYASTRLGTIALFDQWTAAMKQFSAGVINARLLDSIALVNGEKGSAKAVKKAQEFLARNNIDEGIAQIIWREVTNGEGGGKVNGVWLPNTEAWNVADPEVARARRAYRAALAGEVDSTIVTPGFERPSWVDSSLPARMIAQFRSFGLSSTQKTLMAGLQEHDAAFLNGAMLSLGLGALSYYLWAVASGGDAYKEMLDAPVEKWADEAITRSGLTGVFDEVQRTAQRIPVLRDYASLSGKRSSRREGGDLIEGIMGPSFDILDKSATILNGIDEPTRATLHAARQLLPFQNLFYLRTLLDKVEQTIDLPERRQ
jgi:outer membrane murein-binding lipoprotein Lpp